MKRGTFRYRTPRGTCQSGDEGAAFRPARESERDEPVNGGLAAGLARGLLGLDVRAEQALDVLRKRPLLPFRELLKAVLYVGRNADREQRIFCHEPYV